jgi:hypothetical protein
MARALVTDIYAGYCFILHLPERDVWVSAKAAFNDVFTGDLWVGAAHRVNEKTLGEYFSECRRVEVWMFQPARNSGAFARCITASYEGLFLQPVDLDAGASKVAMEWVRLENTKMGKVQDVPRAEWPAGLVREFDTGK